MCLPEIISFKESSSNEAKVKEQNSKVFHFTKSDMILSKGATPGFQPKFKIDNYFVKMQAELSGVLMNDWMVEVIASEFAKTLGIPCVQQYPCDIIVDNVKRKGVYSKNFEFDGFTFVSASSLATKIGYDFDSSEYRKLSNSDKLRKCASVLSLSGNIGYQECERYMLNLAVLDLLVCNSDRHFHNFGLFWDNECSVFRIPLIFDCGMGLFENDYYCKQCTSFDDVMYYAYIQPYSEDPFILVDELLDNFDLSSYNFEEIVVPSNLPNQFSGEYLDRILEVLM